MIQSIHDIKECPDCAGNNLVVHDDKEQILCRDCGLIFEPLAPAEEERFESAHDMKTAKKKASKPKKKK